MSIEVITEIVKVNLDTVKEWFREMPTVPR